MSLFVIGDLHLSLGCDKPMDIFGGRWENYIEKLNEGLSLVKEGDTTVICGDLTWGMTMEEAEEDFQYIHRIPGRKIILKGNHDYWWVTAAKFQNFCKEHGFTDLHLLNNNAYFYGDTAICGTRGWFYEEEKRGGAHDAKILNRELMRLEASLKAAGEKEKFCFLHYPPRYRGYTCPEILALLEKYGVKRCYYGHLHSDSHKLAVEGMANGTDFRLVSADFIGFTPIKVLD